MLPRAGFHTIEEMSFSMEEKNFKVDLGGQFQVWTELILLIAYGHVKSCSVSDFSNNFMRKQPVSAYLHAKTKINAHNTALKSSSEQN